MKIKQKLYHKIYSEFGGLAFHDKVYKTGGLAFILYLLIGFTLAIFFKQNNTDILAEIFMYILSTIFTIAVTIEYWTLIKKIFLQKWFQWFIGIIALLIYKFSETYANHFINNFVGVDPAFLPTASLILSTIYLPYSWLLSISAFLTIFIFINWIFIPFEKNTNNKELGNWKYMARFVGLLVILIVAQKSIFFFQDEKSIFGDISKQIILSTEYFKKSQCDNISQFELSADIGRGYVSIFNINSQKFRIEKCIIKN